MAAGVRLTTLECTTLGKRYAGMTPLGEPLYAIDSPVDYGDRYVWTRDGFKRYEPTAQPLDASID